MRHLRAAACACVVFALAAGGPLPRSHAQAPVVIHGANSVFAAADVVMVWGVLRTAREEDTEVVIRLVAPRFAALRVEAVDPFSGGRREVFPRQALTGAAEVRRRRAHFAEFPRLEAHLEPAPGAAAPTPLTIYYLSVPDTTPEFTSEAALRRYLDDALAKARPPR